MTTEALSVTTTVPAPADAVFMVLADPASHAAIDGTGWVCHPDHPDGQYVVANQVRELDPPHAIAWEPGTEDDEGHLSFGGWSWRYDLAPVVDGGTQVRLTYDWSGATPQAREVIGFPPFGVEHLEDSLRHLAVLATA
jgi:uncharacterized protein YndB with AHSA1/START domain